LVDIDQGDVSAIGLNGWPDDLDDYFNFSLHDAYFTRGTMDLPTRTRSTI
jgi:hypothetical protein